ncbi:MAG TPA: hypothetical protein VE338_10020 [Ktedonobacterales bacterium]|jgi:hypothetical protein|nr:hypothetical protein [Ktedonobacterales bacterium]
MPRRIALWRVELGAGVGAAVIGLFTLPMALLAPLFPVCAVAHSATGACPASATRAVSLLASHPGGDVWALLLGLFALTLLAAAGAVTDARAHPAPGARLIAGNGLAALWGATILVFAVCAIGAGGPLGLLYLPSTLALGLAAYVALLRRLAARRASAPTE